MIFSLAMYCPGQLKTILKLFEGSTSVLCEIWKTFIDEKASCLAALKQLLTNTDPFYLLPRCSIKH